MQAKEGTCSSPKPGLFDFTGRAKWLVGHPRIDFSAGTLVTCHLFLREAWHSLGRMSRDQAMELYLKTVSALAPDWETVKIAPEIQVDNSIDLN